MFTVTHKPDIHLLLFSCFQGRAMAEAVWYTDAHGDCPSRRGQREPGEIESKWINELSLFLWTLCTPTVYVYPIDW